MIKVQQYFDGGTTTVNYTSQKCINFFVGGVRCTHTQHGVLSVWEKHHSFR